MSVNFAGIKDFLSRRSLFFLILASLIFTLLPVQPLVAENHMPPGQMQQDSIDLMQGNSYYNISEFRSKAQPDTVMSWASANLPVIPEGTRGATRKDPNQLAVIFSSESSSDHLSTIRLQKSKVGEDDSTESINCDGFADVNCTSANTKYQSMRIDSFMPPCVADSTSACIKSFALKLSDGTLINGAPSIQVPMGAKSFASKKFLDGSTAFTGSVPWIWKADTKDGASAGYLLRGTLKNYGSKSGSEWTVTKPRFNFEIIPLSLEQTSEITVAPRIEDFAYGKAGYRAVRQVSIQPSCVAHDIGKCYHRSVFPTNARVVLELKLPNSLSGWMSGRLNKPNVVTEQIDSAFDLLKVEAGVGVNVVAGGWVKWKEVPESYFVKADGSQNDFGYGRLSGAAGAHSGGVDTLEIYQLWQKYIPDKALITFPSWTLSSTKIDASQSCVDVKGIQGVVATNASAYSPGAPDFNKESQTLDYRVAAPHFAADGKSENIGTYGLSMRADLVQCLYGVKEVPAKVEISITSGSTGESRGSTVELYRNGNWVYLSAEGFTFSAPTLKVKLVQPEPPKVEVASPATNTATPEVKTVITAKPTPAVAKKIRITCIKGKVTKMVSGTNPKCPTGYKKK